MPETENVLHGVAESREARRPCVGFVATHHRRPLFRGHRRGSGIGEQINQNCIGRNEKKIVAGGLHKFPAFFPGGAADGLDAFDPKRLNDRLDRHFSGFLSRTHYHTD